MRTLFALPWQYWIFTFIGCMGLCILCAMYQQDKKNNFRDRPLVIALGGVAAVVGWVAGIAGVVKFVIWWRQ